MNRSNVRRLVSGGQAVAVVGLVLGLIHCGGGSHPATEDGPTGTFDAGVKGDTGTTTATSGITFPDIDLPTGIVFGDSGLVDCGSQAGDQTFTLHNTTSDIVNFSTSFSSGGSFYTVTPVSGGVPANGNVTVKVSPKPIPAVTDIAPDLFAGTLQVSFPGHGTPQNIRLHQTARGAIITTTQSGGLDFGSVKVGQTGSIPFTLTNKGNIQVTATLDVGAAGFKVDNGPEAAIDLAPSANGSKPVTLSPAAPGSFTDSLTVSFNSSAVQCGVPPDKIPLKGTGTTSVGVSAGTLDFGLVDCNTTAPSQSLTVDGTIAMTFTAVLTKNELSPYTLQHADGTPIAAADSISVAAAGSTTIKIVPKKMLQVSNTADNFFGDTLTLTTDVPGDTPHAILLRETARGGVLKFDQTSIANTTRVNATVNTPFNLVNTGNFQVPYSITTTKTNFVSTITKGNSNVGNTAGVLQSTASTQTGEVVTGFMNVSLDGSGVLCADLPPAMPLSITANGSAITVSPTVLNFGKIDCGSQAAPQTLTLQSVVPTQMTLTLGAGPSSSFTLADKNGVALAINAQVPVTPSTPYILQVVPKGIVAPTSTADNQYGDTLTLTSDIAAEASTPTKIPLQMGAHGASYVFGAPATTANPAVYSFTVTNNGNSNGLINVTGGATPSTGVILGGGATATFTGGKGTYNIVPSSDAATYPVCGNQGTMTIN